MQATRFASLVRGLPRAQARSTPVLPQAPVRPSALLAQALEEGSNLELDWIWYAAQLSALDERRYCLERARYINPASEEAHWALAALETAR